MKRKLYDNFRIFPVEGGKDKAPLLIRDKNNDPIIKKDGTPMRYTWSKVVKNKCEWSEIDRYSYFGVCGGVDGLEIIDVDNKFHDAVELFKFIKDNFDLTGFLIIGTQSGGFHIYYRCPNPMGNLKLAMRQGTENIPGKAKKEVITLVETRGVGGYVVFYDNILQGSIETVPTITTEQRDELLTICRALNEVEDKKAHEPKIEINDNAEAPGNSYNNDYSSIAETKQILLNAGWVAQGDYYWRRPGKTDLGISASFGKVGKNKFYVFSSNASPFDMQCSYSMFAVRAYLLHNKDFSECGKELFERYNPGKKRSEKKKKPESNIKEPKNQYEVLQNIFNEWNIKVRKNLLIGNIEFQRDGSDWDNNFDVLVGDIMVEMETSRFTKVKDEWKPVRISKNKINDILLTSTFCEMYNPVIKFINELPEWDGIDRFDEMTKYINLQKDEDPVFFASMLKKHFIRAFDSIYNDNANRFVFTLYGPQEIGKSKWVSWLVPAELYNDEMIDPIDKDSILSLTRYLVKNIDELDDLDKKEVAHLKAFISKGDVTKRVSYGRFDQKHKRIATLFASTNKSDILVDVSNTRWLILKVKSFDWRGYTANMDSRFLWSQALYEYKKNKNAGELTDAEKSERDIRNGRDFLNINPEREMIVKHFNESDYGNKYTSTDIKVLLENQYPGQKLNFTQLNRELKRLFGEPMQTRHNGINGRYFKLNSDLKIVSRSEYGAQSFNEVDKKQEEAPF